MKGKLHGPQQEVKPNTSVMGIIETSYRNEEDYWFYIASSVVQEQLRSLDLVCLSCLAECGYLLKGFSRKAHLMNLMCLSVYLVVQETIYLAQDVVYARFSSSYATFGFFFRSIVLVDTSVSNVYYH